MKSLPFQYAQIYFESDRFYFPVCGSVPDKSHSFFPVSVLEEVPADLPAAYTASLPLEDPVSGNKLLPRLQVGLAAHRTYIYTFYIPEVSAPVLLSDPPLLLPR